MKTGILVASLFILALFCMPVAASDPENRYSYITYESVDIALDGADAVITVSYSIDTGVQVLVMLLGNHDLRTKLLRSMNFEGAKIQYADLERAVLTVDDASFDYGDGSFWFPRHSFMVTIPELNIQTPQSTRQFFMIQQMEEGFGYFAALP
ncbi:hypothetical protein [Methanocalculus sp.]|uniref:hypothetical protein n=1 Tax=Methanocalculus sp. TaxID=2004547 RepID=UPI0026137FBF|nr:hypothetical protein [Methanocalculus sp.]MDG6250247.1 hypothetical protein [Methanocalculus sp.]